MKHFTILICLLIGLQSVAQSKKKTNVQLKAELDAQNREFDSMRTVYSDLSAHWRWMLSKEYSKLNELKGVWKNILSMEDNFLANQRTLEKLGEKQDSIPRAEFTAIDRVASSYKALEQFQKRFSYVMEHDFSQGSLKEQNENLEQQIRKCDETNKENLRQICDLKSVILQMDTLIAISDSLKIEYGTVLSERRQYNNQSINRLLELEKKYRENEGKEFPEVYAEVFLPEAPHINTYDIVDEMPQLSTGVSVREYVEVHTVMPECVKNGSIIGGNIFVSFVISQFGDVTDVHLLQGLPDCLECNAEALRVVTNLPFWIPGKIKGKYVNTRYSLSITFAQSMN